MKTSKLIFGLAFSVLASSAFAAPHLPSLPGNNNTNLVDPTPTVIFVAADGADHVGANRLAADGADHVGANRLAADGSDHVGANRLS